MPDDPCTICGGPLAHHPGETYACEGCVWTLRFLLRELPRHLPLLDACLVPDGAPRTGRTTGAGAAHAPAPVRLDVLNLIGPGHWTADDTTDVPVQPLLHGWATRLAAECGFHVGRDPHGTQIIDRRGTPCSRRGSGPAAWAAWLHAYTPLAAGRPWIREMHDQIEDLLRRILAITGTTPRRRNRAAPCPDCGAFDLVATDGEWWITCTVCGHRLTRDAYDDHAVTTLAALHADAGTDAA